MCFLPINVGCCRHPDKSQQLLHGPSAWFRGLFKSRVIHVTPLLWVFQRLRADKSNICIAAAFVIQPGLSSRLQCRGYSHESKPLEDSTLWPGKPFRVSQPQTLLLHCTTQPWRGLLLLLPSFLQTHMLFMLTCFLRCRTIPITSAVLGVGTVMTPCRCTSKS